MRSPDSAHANKGRRRTTTAALVGLKDQFVTGRRLQEAASIIVEAPDEKQVAFHEPEKFQVHGRGTRVGDSVSLRQQRPDRNTTVIQQWFHRLAQRKIQTGLGECRQGFRRSAGDRRVGEPSRSGAGARVRHRSRREKFAAARITCAVGQRRLPCRVRPGNRPDRIIGRVSCIASCLGTISTESVHPQRQ